MLRITCINSRPESWSETKSSEVVEEPAASVAAVSKSTSAKDEGDDSEEYGSDEDSEDSDFDLGGNPNRRRFYVESDSEEDSEEDSE